MSTTAFQTLDNGVLRGSAVPDTALSTSYIKADGSRLLTSSWNAGAFTITANSVQVGSAANTISGLATIINSGTLTLPTTTDTLVGKATTDILTNKTLTTPTISTILNTGVLTLPTSTDTLVGRATTDTGANRLQNKDVDASNFNIVDPAATNKKLKFDISGTLANTALTIAPTQTSNQTLTIPNITGSDTLVTQNFTQSLSNKTLDNTTSLAIKAANFTIRDGTDTTKVLNFSLSGMTASRTLTLSGNQTTSQTLSFPNITGADTVATLGLAQTFSALITLSATNTSLSATGKALLALNGGSDQATALVQIGQAASGSQVLLAGTTQQALLAQVIGNSSATSRILGIAASFISQATSFTAGVGAGIRILTPTIGAGSTVTRNVGLLFQGVGTSGTNNAYITDNESFTGNFFINQSGTDASSFSGATTFAASSVALTVNNDSVFLGRLALLTASPSTASVVSFNGTAPSSVTGTTQNAVSVQFTANASNTVTLTGYSGKVTTGAAVTGARTYFSNVPANTGGAISNYVDYVAGGASSHIGTNNAAFSDGNSLGTGNFFVYQAGTDMSLFTGQVNVSTLASATTGANVTLFSGPTFTNPSVNSRNIFGAMTNVATSGANANILDGGMFTNFIGAANTQNWTANTPGVTGIRADVRILSGATGTVSNFIGLASQFLNSASGAVCTNSYGVQLGATTATGTVTNNMGFVSNIGTVGTNNVDVLIGTLTAPSGNFGIYQSSTTANQFGGSISTSSFFKPTANTAFSAGTLQKLSTDGVVLSGATGSTYDLALAAVAGQEVLVIPTGTSNVTLRSGGVDALTIGASQAATFAGSVTIGSGSAASNAVLVENGGTNSGVGSGTTFQRGSTTKGYVGTESFVIGGTSDAITVGGASGVGVKLSTNGGTVALTVDTSQNVATTAGTATQGYETSTVTSGTITTVANKPGLSITGAGGTTLTIKLPPSPIDGQQYWVASQGNFTTVTWQDNGGTAGNVIGGQASLGGTARGQRFVYITAQTKWFSVS